MGLVILPKMRDIAKIKPNYNKSSMRQNEDYVLKIRVPPGFSCHYRLAAYLVTVAPALSCPVPAITWSGRQN